MAGIRVVHGEVASVRARWGGWVACGVGALCIGLLAARAVGVPRCGDITLRQVVLRLLRDDGDPVPAVMRFQRVAGSDDTLLYEVVLVGRFAARTESRPLDAAAPTGTTLVLYVDASDGGITDLTLSDRAAPRLGRHARAVLL